MRSHLLAAAMAAAATTLLSACGVLSSGGASPPAPSDSAMSASSGATGGAGAADTGGMSGAAGGGNASANSMSGTAGLTGTAGTLRTEQTAAGTVLATTTGLTLYYYTGDHPGTGVSRCTGSCAVSWPPLVAPVRVPRGVKLGGPVSKITRSDGLTQVTIDGYPIYRYTGDTMPGQATGNGVGGEWHAVKVRSAHGHKTGGLMRVEHTTAGLVLANPHGMSVYYFAGDQPNSGVSACTGGCTLTWPPVTAPVRLPAGLKLAGPIGFIIRPDGTRQVTVDGYPIYRYAGDHAPGQVNGNGIGGQWHVVHVPAAAPTHY